MIAYGCRACGARHAVTAGRFRCDCGGTLDLSFEAEPVAREALPRRPQSIWRYHEALPLAEVLPRATLGEGVTPIVDGAVGGVPVHFVLEYASPSGSYKDRGAALLVSLASWLGVDTVVDDTSGNAGIALAAHAGHAGLASRLFVPADAPEAKPRLAAAFGAEVIRVPGPRAAAAAAALREAETGAFYASHAWNPFFVHGVKTLAYSLAEALGWSPPGAVVVPCGNGGLVLGLDLGFREMRRHGLIERRPAIVAVQADACAPIARAAAEGGTCAALVDERPTAADGIRVAAPPRGSEVLAVLGHGGEAGTVSEDEIATARRALWHDGFAVETTSAVAPAYVAREGERLRSRYGDLAIVLTGSGLKEAQR
jgi:threonine synthase